MKVIRRQQPLIPWLWSLQRDNTEVTAAEDDLLIKPQPAVIDGQGPENIGRESVVTHCPFEGLEFVQTPLKSAGGGSKTTEFSATSGGVAFSESSSMDSLTHRRYSSPLRQQWQSLSPGPYAACGLVDNLSGGNSLGEPAAPTPLAGLNKSTAGDLLYYLSALDEPTTAVDLADIEHDHSSHGFCELISERDWLAFEAPSDTATIDNSSVEIGSTFLPFDQTFRLHSNPGASKIIYLDFDGHTTSGTRWNDVLTFADGSQWNGGTSFYSPSFDYDGVSGWTDYEYQIIQSSWQRVAADFAGLDVDVTTQAPPDDWLINSGTGDPYYGVRVVITSYGPASTTAGGIAWIDSFSWGSDTPAFVYNSTKLGISEAVSHEVGHTLGLSHDGTSTTAYYAGHGTSTYSQTGWAPIMGASYYYNMSTWDNGVYYDSNNTGDSANYGRGADDLAIITGQNGFGYAADQEGDSPSVAVGLRVAGGQISQFGVIGSAADQDCFRLDLLHASDVLLKVNAYIFQSYVDADGVWGADAFANTALSDPLYTSTDYADHATNLLVRLDVYDASGQVKYSSTTAPGYIYCGLYSLPAGTYYFMLNGVGIGDPASIMPSGFTDCASMGNYLITGTVTPLGNSVLPEISLAIDGASSVMEDGSANLVFTFSRSLVTSDPLTVYFTASGSATNGVDYSGLMAGNTQSVTFAAGAQTATVLIDPTADSSAESDETVRLALLQGTDYTGVTDGYVSGTIVNDDVAQMPVITLDLAPSSVLEDGNGKLMFIFSRSVVTADTLTVNYSVTGTAVNGADYSGLVAGSSQSVTFAANAATASVVIDPTADNTVESDETVSFMLQADMGYILGSSGVVSGTIINDDSASMLVEFTSGFDRLTGGTAADTFHLSRYSDALWSSTPDRITGLQAGLDIIDSPVNRTAAISVKQLGSVKTLDAAGIGSLLTNKAFAKNAAVTFTFGTGNELRTFLAINDAMAGYKVAADSVIEITGYSGNLSALSIF